MMKRESNKNESYCKEYIKIVKLNVQSKYKYMKNIDK